MKYIIFTTVIFFVFNIFSYDLHSQEVDLVKLKKQEEERKKKAKKSKHVLTNDNLDKIKVEKKPHAFIKAEKKKGSDKTNVSTGSNSGSETGKKQTKEYWRREMKKLLEEKSRVEDALKKMQNEYEELRFAYPSVDILSKRTEMRDRIEELKKLIEENEKLLEDVEKKINALKDRARKKGIPPGWLRGVQAAPPPSTDAVKQKDN